MGKKDKIDPRTHIRCLNGKGKWTFLSTFGEEELCHDGPCGLRLEDGRRSTVFPSPAAVAASFDVELAKACGSNIGNAFKNEGFSLALTPGANIKRSALCGRNFEYFSEDPLLNGLMAASYIQGIQSTGVGACLKHYLANNQEWYRHISESVVSYRALRGIYARSFEIALEESKPFAIMTSYNRVNGNYVSSSKPLLRDLLRGEFGYDGLVISDWGGATFNDGGCFRAGLDIEMPYRPGAVEQFQRNYGKSFSEVDLNERLKCISNFFSKAKKAKGRQITNDSVKGYLSALETARSTIILAKNESSFLPFEEKDDVLIVGSLALEPHIIGGGSAKVLPDVEVNYLGVLKSKGLPFCYIDGYKEGTKLNQVVLASEAKKHNKILFFLGMNEGDESEGRDRNNISIKKEQLEALNTVLSVNPNVCVVLMTGGVLDVSPFVEKVPSILVAYDGGEAICEAIFETVYGHNNPSGRFIESWPLSLRDNPLYAKWHEDAYHAYYDEDIYVGYRYYDKAKTALAFRFGEGLSYSSFELSDMKTRSLPSGGCQVILKAKNTSGRDGATPILVFGEYPNGCDFYHEERFLAAFTKVFLKAGEEKEVLIAIPTYAFKVYLHKGLGGEIEDGIYTLTASIDGRRDGISSKTKIKGKKLKGAHTPSTLKRRHYESEYRFDWNSPLGAFALYSGFLKEHIDCFDTKEDAKWLIHSEEPIRSLLLHKGFKREDIEKAIDDTNEAMGGQCFVPITI